MKVCIYGAGAIGGHLAARLAQAGAEVSLIARGAHLAALRADGLRLEAPDGDQHHPLTATDDPAELGPQGLVLVTVKAPALPEVAAHIGALLRPATPVVFITNGIPWWYFQSAGGPHDGLALHALDPGGALAQAVEPRRVIGGVITSGCTVVAPGVVRVETAHNLLELGEPGGRLSQRAERVAALLRSPVFEAIVKPNLRDAIWTKLIRNLGSGLVSVLSASAPRDALADPAIAQGLHAISAEAAAIAQACGCTPEVDAAAQIAAYAQTAHRPSILHDLERGRPMEIEAMFRAPLHLARLFAVETPLLDLLVALATERARGAGLYP